MSWKGKLDLIKLILKHDDVMVIAADIKKDPKDTEFFYSHYGYDNAFARTFFVVCSAIPSIWKDDEPNKEKTKKGKAKVVTYLDSENEAY